MEAQVAALEGFVAELRAGLDLPDRAAVLAQQTAALELCILIYRLILKLSQ